MENNPDIEYQVRHSDKDLENPAIFDTEEDALVFIDRIIGQYSEWTLWKHEITLVDANYANYN